MKKNISLYENKGIALIMVLSILIILLILSLAIVSLSTGNLRTTGNVRARFEALNLATSAINYNMYDFNHMSTSIMTPYPPGATPMPLSSVPVHGPYNVTIDNPSLDMSQASCKYMYAENLSNPNPTTANFAPYVCDPNVPGNTIVIIGEGTYRGYKRVIRAVVRNNPGVAMGMCCDKDANLASIVVDPNGDSNSRLIVNGINDMTSCEPIAGSVQANKDLSYSNTDPNSCRFYNGSSIRAVGTVNAPAVEDKHKVSGAAPVDIQEWKISDVVDIAGCTPVPAVTVTPGPNTSAKLAIIASTTPLTCSVVRPEAASLPTPSISDNESYIAGNRSYVEANPDLIKNYPTLFVKKNTKVNGNLIVYGNLKLEDGATLFVNGVLEIKGNVQSGYTDPNLPNGGNIVTAGYKNSTDSDKGNSLEINGQIEQNSMKPFASKGNIVLSEGNIYLHNSTNNNSNDWLYEQPLNVKTTIKALKLAGADKIVNPGYNPNGIKDWWSANKSTLQDPSQVGDEAAAWFNDPRADIYMDDTDPNNPFYQSPNNWVVFTKNPSVFFNKNQSFFQGVMYSYGDITIDGPINLIGGAVTVKGAYTPPDSTGSIYAYRGGNIVANMEYMAGSKPFYRILTDVLSWCEL